MITLLQVIGWIWVFAVWIGACCYAAQTERYGWLLLWIFVPPVAWIGEVLMGFIALVISLGPSAEIPTWIVVVGLVLITGWMVPFAIAFALEWKKP